MSASDLLSSLEHVREVRPGQWRAKSPCHGGRSDGSLSISETADGTLLLRCWGGCDARAIVEAVGLTLGDLFPARDLSPEVRRSYAREKGKRQLYAELSHECWVAAQIFNAHATGRPVIDPDPAGRECACLQRLLAGLEAIYGH